MSVGRKWVLGLSLEAYQTVRNEEDGGLANDNRKEQVEKNAFQEGRAVLNAANKWRTLG